MSVWADNKRESVIQSEVRNRWGTNKNNNKYVNLIWRKIDEASWMCMVCTPLEKMLVGNGLPICILIVFLYVLSIFVSISLFHYYYSINLFVSLFIGVFVIHYWIWWFYRQMAYLGDSREYRMYLADSRLAEPFIMYMRGIIFATNNSWDPFYDYDFFFTMIHLYGSYVIFGKQFSCTFLYSILLFSCALLINLYFQNIFIVTIVYREIVFYSMRLAWLGRYFHSRFPILLRVTDCQIVPARIVFEHRTRYMRVHEVILMLVKARPESMAIKFLKFRKVMSSVFLGVDYFERSEGIKKFSRLYEEIRYFRLCEDFCAEKLRTSFDNRSIRAIKLRVFWALREKFNTIAERAVVKYEPRIDFGRYALRAMVVEELRHKLMSYSVNPQLTKEVEDRMPKFDNWYPMVERMADHLYNAMGWAFDERFKCHIGDHMGNEYKMMIYLDEHIGRLDPVVAHIKPSGLGSFVVRYYSYLMEALRQAENKQEYDRVMIDLLMHIPPYRGGHRDYILEHDELMNRTRLVVMTDFPASWERQGFTIQEFGDITMVYENPEHWNDFVARYTQDDDEEEFFSFHLRHVDDDDEIESYVSSILDYSSFDANLPTEWRLTNLAGEAFVDEWDDRPAWMLGYGDHLDFRQTISIEDVIDGITEFGDDFRDKVEVMGWLFKPQEHRFSTITFYEHIAKLLYRLCNVDSLASAIAFIHDVGVLFQSDFNITSYMVKASCYLAPLIEELTQFISTASWADSFKENFIYANFRSFLKLVGVAIIGPIVWAVLGKFFFDPILIKWYSSEASDVKSYANAVSELITLIANNPYYLVSRDINDIIRFEPPGFSLFKKLVSIEKTIDAFTLKTSVDDILDAICTLERLETDIMATVSFAKLPGEVNGANILMDKVTRMRKGLVGRVAEDIHRLEPVGLEIYSPQTKIGKSTMAMRLARDLLSYKGYSMVHNLIHVYEQEKFAESAGTFTKIVIMDDPDVSNTKEGQDSMIAQLMAMIDSTKHYIRKAAVEKKQIDYWDLHAAIVTCNTPTVEIAATLMRSTECIGRRLKYRIIPKLLDGCTEFSKAASKPNDSIWECQLFVWTDDHKSAAGYVDTGKVIRYGDVLSLLISETNMNEAILRDRMSEKPAPVCQACVDDWQGPCTHGVVARVDRDPRFKATVSLADIPYGFKLVFGAVIGFCLFPSFMLGFVYSLAFIDWYFDLFWRASGWFARKYFKLRRGVSLTKEEIFDIWKIHKANISGFLLLAAVVYGGQKLYAWWMKEAEEPEFKATMEYSNAEIPILPKKLDEVPVLYPKSSNGVQDLEKWKRDVLSKNLYCLQVYYGDEIKNNYCNAVSVGGNLLAIPHHVVRGEIIHTIIKSCDRVAPKGVFSHTVDEFHNIKEDLSVFARGGFFLASDLTKFMLEQTPVPGQKFEGGIMYRTSENVLIHKVCTFIYTIDFKPIANVSANGVVGITNYYIADCVCPEGSSGGLAYAVRDGKPFILGSNVATSFKLKQVVIQAWFKEMFIDVDTRMAVNFNVSPPLADEFESFNRVLSKVEVIREPVSDDSLWGINATNVGRASTMSIKQSSTLEDLDASGEFRATMCECLDTEIKKFVVPEDKIDEVTAVHKHLSKATCERLVPALVLDKVAEMWFEVNRKRLTRYKDEPYRLPHEAALRGWDADRWNQLPMTSLKLSTSSGIRGGGVKREHVIVTPTPDDPNKFILDEDMKQRYNIVNLVGSRHHVVAPVIFSSSLKMNEPRPVGKHCRVFNFMGMAKTVVDREVVFPILSMLVGGFLETGVAIGGVTFNEDCQLMFERLKKARRHFGLDIKGMDMSQGKDIQMVIILLAKKLFKLNGWPDEDFEVFKTQYLMVIHWCTHYKFDIIYPMSGMPTGFVGTTLQNCLIIQLCMVFCAMQVSQLHRISFAEAWRELVNLIYGDDQTPSFRDLEVEVPITLYAASFNALGFQVTLADKTDIADAKPEALLGELEFLKRKFQEIKYNGKVYVVMSLSFESIYKMLVFREPSSAVTREEWIRIVFDNAQFEMAFHGMEIYEKCHDVLVIYKNKNDPSLIIKPWSFWIEKFLSGVAPYQYC